VRSSLTRDSLRELMRALARSAPKRGTFRVYLLGGGTAVLNGWRVSTIDADLYSDHDAIFRDIQGLKERLNLNVEFVRPEDFVPALPGTASRHVFIETIGKVSFYHYDPYAQVLSKLVRGFDRDLDDAGHFVSSRMVEPKRLQSLVDAIPGAAYAKYPALSADAVSAAVADFLSGLPR